MERISINYKIKNHSTLLDIFSVQEKSMNHINMFLLITKCNHDNETLAKNRSEMKKPFIQPKNIILVLKNILIRVEKTEFRYVLI